MLVDFQGSAGVLLHTGHIYGTFPTRQDNQRLLNVRITHSIEKAGGNAAKSKPTETTWQIQ